MLPRHQKAKNRRASNGRGDQRVELGATVVGNDIKHVQVPGAEVYDECRCAIVYRTASTSNSMTQLTERALEVLRCMFHQTTGHFDLHDWGIFRGAAARCARRNSRYYFRLLASWDQGHQ